MPDYKIIIDTNVIVAASIIENVGDLEIQVKHRFYDESIQLFSIFKKDPAAKRGISTPTMRRESFLVLAKAIKDVFLTGISPTDIRLKEFFYNNASAILFSSDHKMRDLFGYLYPIFPSRQHLRQAYHDVQAMSAHLRGIWDRKYGQKYSRIQESKSRAKNIKEGTKWKDEQKDEVFYTHKGQVDQEAKQLERFMRKYPNNCDQKILAESVAIHRYYKSKNQQYTLYLASCDRAFFSPYIWHDYVSDIVTREIHNRFCVVCNVPREVYASVGGYHQSN